MRYFGWINIYVQGEKTTPHPHLHKLIQTLCEMAQKINEDVKIKKGFKTSSSLFDIISQKETGIVYTGVLLRPDIL